MEIGLLYLFVGAVGGVIIGALGSGSSLVILPVLSLIFLNIFPEAVSLKVAVASCLAILIVGSISGSISYIKAKLFNVELVKWCLPGVIGGAILSPLISHLLPSSILRVYIAILIIAIASYKLLKSINKKDDVKKPLEPLLLMITSLICTTLSGLAGVALGILMIPFLSRYAEHRAVLGTNLILAVPYSIIGTVGYIVSGLHADISGSHFLLGYVYLPAFLFISITMAIFPPVGLKIVKNIGPTITQRIFYIYLLVIGITILL